MLQWLSTITKIAAAAVLLCCLTYFGLASILDQTPPPPRKAPAPTDSLPSSIEVWLYDYPMADVQTLVKSQALAVKNRNPLNVKIIATDEPWLGQIGIDRYGHAIFSTFSYGIRAGALTLRTYAKRYGINTIEGIISRFTEGDQIQIDKYILYLSAKLKVDPKQRINMKTMLPRLLRHMSRYECGLDLPESLFTPYDILADM